MGREDTYQTIVKPSEGILKDKGSKFIALAYPVRDETEVKLRLEEAKNNFHDARHHCYAWVLGFEGEQFRINDDGEPSGTAGKPIHGQIMSAGLTNILIVVVRYFGGTKLGVRGLINAYKGAAREALANNQQVTRHITHHYRLSFDYLQMNDVMRILKEFDLPQHGHDFDLNCSLEFTVRASRAVEVTTLLEKIHGVNIDLLSIK